MSDRRNLNELENRNAFISRHIGPDEDEIREMLKTLDVTSLDTLIEQTVPANIRQQAPLDLPGARTEDDVAANARELSERNQVMRSMIGMGYYDTFTPAVIRRNILENPGWYTAYTPYQAEVSQGRLEALLNYQQMVMDLTGMDLANASLLDEGTAAAEAMAMASRVAKSKGNVFVVDDDCNPQTIAIVQTRAKLMDIEVRVGDIDTHLEDDNIFGVLLQYPGSLGEIRDPSPQIAKAHDKKALAIVVTDLLALTALKSPGEMDADVVLGNSQRFGVPMGYGGPHAAFFATRDAYKRSTPGRIIGVSIDSNGSTALRMALQTREQHIRRDKATSNICTAQVLLAVMAGFYAVYHGADGIRRIGERTHRFACMAAGALKDAGFEIQNTHLFDTVTVNIPGNAAEIVNRARSLGLNLRHVDDSRVSFAMDETTTRDDLTTLLRAFEIELETDIDALDAATESAIPESLRRTSSFMDHAVFKVYRSETEILRYMRKLQSRDIALDRSMIPLGSCTMKLNATTEMEPVTLPGFAQLHPFAPLNQATGYAQLFQELESDLCEITGYDAISLQPNAGSQGEYAGLLCIRKYHDSRGESHRNICLIPSSAHGTNPASAVMAGMKVVVVKCDADGNVDVDDLTARVEEHKEHLGALMVTYPSTHGVFEEAITQICDIVHAGGGQVYMDGANLNALVGLVQPGKIGADVSHLNLHKTFCIPHGGGGPGMGPIGVREHLAKFLPDHPVVDDVNPRSGPDDTVGTVSAAPWGSAAILPISWAYIKMMGGEGLTHASKVAIASANYMATRLAPHYPIVYKGHAGRVAHECIIDFAPIKDATDISVEDVAKRLVDYGFHAPTMSWPVHDSLMIEPTESESKAEIDRFCDALISIRAEIAEVESGTADRENNVLTNAPHASLLLTTDTWDRPYSKEQAFFPVPGMIDDKYWPPVGRVDNVHGDRNLVCACPPMSDYEDVA